MKMELEEALCRDFPHLAQDWHGSPRQTCMAWGFVVGDGWEPILRNLFTVIESERLKLPPEFAQELKLAQVKEKFGGLRVYLHFNPDGCYDSIHAAVKLAEEMALLTCEDCGSKKNVETKGSYIRTLCGECRSKRKSSPPQT